MHINKNVIELVKRNQKETKSKNFLDNEYLKKEFFTSLKNYEFNLTKKSSYEIALWIESNEKHLFASRNNNLKKYKLGDIVLVDLGWNIYNGEFSYIHPAIIIKQTPAKVFIVPCTSSNKKYKKVKKYPEYEIGNFKDGFKKDSIVMLYEAKYVDKNRIISILGRTSKEFFDKIYNKLFMQIFEPIYYKLNKNFENVKK